MDYVDHTKKGHAGSKRTDTSQIGGPQTDGAQNGSHERRTGWSRQLARPVALRNGPKFITLADVRSFLFKRMQVHRKETPDWQRVTSLLISAVRSDEVDVAEVTIAVEMAASRENAPASKA